GRVRAPLVLARFPALLSRRAMSGAWPRTWLARTWLAARRKDERDRRAAACGVGGSRRSAMRLGDRPHDREAETRAAAAPRLVRAGEPLERPAQERIRKSRPVVSDGHLDRPVDGRRLEPHLAVAVPERVVDEVPERLLEPD